DGGDDRADRAGGGAEYPDRAGDDGDGEVSGHRRADVDGREARADTEHFHAAGPADRSGGHGGGPDRRLHALLLRRPLSLVEAERADLRAELRSVRAASAGWRLDRGGGHFDQ